MLKIWYNWLDSLDNVQSCIQKASEGMQFHQAEVTFYSTNGRLGSNFDIENPTIGKVVRWVDPQQNGYFSRDKEFVAEFQISGEIIPTEKSDIFYGRA